MDWARTQNAQRSDWNNAAGEGELLFCFLSAHSLHLPQLPLYQQHGALILR